MQPQQEESYWSPDADTTDTQSVAPEQVPEQTQTEPIDAPISWQASEFVHYEKSGLWFLALLGVAFVLLLIDIFLIKSWTFGVLIMVMTLAAIVIGRRPPRILNYLLSAQGIQIDEKAFSFHDFRAFGVVQEGAFYSIRLIPNKRFMPMVSVYFPNENGEQIVDMFGARLPMEHVELDLVDRLVEKIRF